MSTQSGLREVAVCCHIRLRILLTLVGVCWLFCPVLQAQPTVTTPGEASASEKLQARRANRLAQSSSPYLLQHAHNPVDWYPWGPEALEKARNENKPIFLSVGYSSCFWCHVMERQVFENEEIARYMNEHFVNIKVDREERPDLDEIYMLSLQIYFQLAGSSQGGGWPLSMFLTPAGEPIAGGTYFPPEDLPGRPGFMTVMRQLDAAWKQQEEAVVRTAGILAQEVRRLSQPAVALKTDPVAMKDVEAALATVLESYDPVSGGFDFDANVPEKAKFPVPSKLALIQFQLSIGHPANQELARRLDHSLQAMAAGGIYDHLGGGFHRYSTDREWLVPHFEKMLYDNAQLAEVYALAYQRTKKKQYRDVAEGTLDYVVQQMRDPRGGFYSALDAETEGIEGKHYIWSREELQRLLNASNYRIFAAAYGINAAQSFEHGYVLHLPRPLGETAQELGMPIQELEARLAKMRTQLLAERNKREALLLDDKILTSWNGLMIRAFARTGAILQRPEYVEKASQAALYLLSTLRDREGRLLRTARGGEASLGAYLDDYAFFISGLLTLYDVTREEKWLNAARHLADGQINLFWDRERGGFFFTAHDHESLITRMKTAYDSVLPSGNSVSVQNFTRLAQITGETVYADYARKTIAAFAEQLRQNPGNLPYFAMAVQGDLIVRGEGELSPRAGQLFAGGVSSPRPEAPAVSANTPGSNDSTSAPTSAPTSNEKPEAERVVGLTPEGGKIDPDARITATGYFAEHAIAASGKQAFAIEIKIDEGWHINANPRQPEFVIPTELKVSANSVAKLAKVVYPAGHAFRLEGIDEPLSVYEGTILLRGELEVPAEVGSEVEIKLQLTTQACNNQSCLAPKRTVLVGKLPVLKPGEVPRKQNQQLFKDSPAVDN